MDAALGLGLVGATGALAGALLGFVGGMVTSARQRRSVEETIRAEFQRQGNEHEHQDRRDALAAERAYAQRAEELFRPYLHDALAVARVVTSACEGLTQVSPDVYPELDRCIDRLETSSLTLPLADACTELRVKALQFSKALEVQKALVESMKSSPSTSTGNQLANREERVLGLMDDARAAAARVRAQVRALIEALHSRQRGRTADTA